MSEEDLVELLSSEDLEISQDLFGHWFYHDAIYKFVSQAFPTIEALNNYMKETYVDAEN